MIQNGMAKTVVVCDTQPLSIEGLRTILATEQGLRFAGAMTSIAGVMELVRGMNPSVAILDRAFGASAILDAIRTLRNTRNTAPIVWGVGLSNAEALRMVQAGARGVIRKTSDTQQVVDCIRTVAAGNTWMEDTILQDPDRSVSTTRSSLTPREHEVVGLVEKGFKNKDIAQSLGIQTGTVKIHLKHIFEKTGCRGRYGLALTGLRERGEIFMSA
jgi:DNA-binding NarL/FixJ family response regulator